MSPSGAWGLQVRGIRCDPNDSTPVLLVDDDPSKRLALKAILAPLGLRIVEADSGEGALREILREDFAVILLDVRMPGMDGFETAALIRRRRESEMTPIIFITAHAVDEIAPKAQYVEGAVDFMGGSLIPDELRAKVSVFVNLFVQAQGHAAKARKVQDSADELMLLMDSAPVGIFRADAQNRYVYTNPRWSAISGVSAGDALGKDWETILSEAHATSSSSASVVERPDSEARKGIFTLTLPDSSKRIVLLTAEPICEIGETVSGWVGTLADVTAETQADEERARFRSLVQNSRDVIAVIDASGRFSYVSPAVREVTGFSPDELTGSRGFDFIHPEDLESVIQHLDQITAEPGTSQTVEVRIRTKAGAWIWIEIRATNRLEDSSIEGIVLNYHDITDRRDSVDLLALSERQLRESEELFRGAFDASQTGIALLAADGLTYLDVNQALCEMLGYTKAELMELNWQAITHPADLERNLDEFNGLLDGREKVGRISKRYLCKDGGAIWVEICDSVVRGPDGQAAYFVVHASNVTERLKANAVKETLENQLTQAQKMEAVGQLAGGVAHDFNNILSVILNYAQFASEGLEPGDSRLADIQEISNAGEKAAKLVHQLLAFSRKEVIEAQVIDLNEVVGGVYEMLSRSLGEDIDLDFTASEYLPLVSADPGRIEQVLLNLAVNARDAMPDGGTLKIETTSESVAEGALPPLAHGVYVVVTVTDSGTGMDQVTIERVFEPFFTTKPRGEGTGMGLSSAYGIIEQAGGAMFVSSTLGEGTSFQIYLPTTDLPVQEFAAAPVVESATGSETILLVEDEEGVRNLVSRILQKHGYNVVTCHSGAEALDYCRSHFASVDLLLTDVVMPKMSGKELSEAAGAICIGLQTLFMSGYTDALIAQRGVLAAGENLISKPFTSDELLHTVRSVLEARVAI